MHFGWDPTATGGICTCTGDMNTSFAAPAVAAAHANGRSIILAVGEANEGTNFAGATQSLYIDSFVTNIVSTMQQYGYDGVDIDWEENVTLAPYATLIQKLRTALDNVQPGIWLSIDVDPPQVAPAIVASVASYVTEVNDMTYYNDGISDQNKYIAAGV